MKPMEFQKWVARADDLIIIQVWCLNRLFIRSNFEKLKFADIEANRGGSNEQPVEASQRHGVIEERITDERRCPRRNMPGATRHGMAWPADFIVTGATIAAGEDAPKT